MFEISFLPSSHTNYDSLLYTTCNSAQRLNGILMYAYLLFAARAVESFVELLQGE